MPLRLRMDGETHQGFRERAERAARIARVLVEACLNNHLIRELIDSGETTREACFVNPTVRVEYEQAYAIGGIGESLEATKYKHWGDGPYILPLEPDDEFFTDRITYVYRENSLYNRRFEQRMRLKELLKQHRSLVTHAKNKLITKAVFLRDLTEEQAQAIRRILHVEPGDFWRACKGKTFLDLPTKPIQLELFER